MIKLPQARGDVRTLVGAVSLGSIVGLGIGAAYLAGGMAREVVVHAQIQRLAGTASTGYSEAALSASTATDPGALAIARRHDPLATADLDLRQQRIADLVERLGHKPATSGNVPVAGAAANASVIKASFIRPTIAAAPFALRGALDESRDAECLSQAVYYEARGESGAGQQAVAQVVLNRVRHPAFPKSVCAVVFQGARTASCQFSFACDGAFHHPVESLAWRRAEQVAAKALGGAVMAEVGNATHFHVAGLSTDWHLTKVAQIGSHIFYRFGGHNGAPGMFKAEPQPSDKAVEVKPVFASLAPSLPTGAQASAAAGRFLTSTANAVEHAAAAVESAAKSVTAPESAKPALAPVVKPAPVVAPPSDDTSTAKAQPAA